jgi:hypothetical protein
MTVRELDAADLAASWAVAQADLDAAPAGAVETWVVPGGVFELAAGLVAGADGKSLTLRAHGATMAVGTAAPVVGDVVALDLVGADVRVEGLTLQVRGTGDVVGLRVRSTSSCELESLVVGAVEGETATGVDAASPSGSLVAVVARDVVASAGEATGVMISDGVWSLSRLQVGPVGGGLTRGLRVRTTSMTGIDLQAGQIAGDVAEALALRCTDELTLLDAHVDQVSAIDDATGAVLVCAGDVAARGLSVETVEGARATAAVVVAGREVDWSGGRLSAVRGTTGGAVGVRVLGAPERAFVRLDDLSVEEVSGAQPGLTAEPADSWRTWLDDAVGALTAGTELPAWPSPGDPGHVESVAGIHVCAPVNEGFDWLESTDPGPVEVAQCVLERVSGTALQVVADLRDIELRGLLVWTAARAGHVEGERVLLAQATVHRVGSGLGFGPCSLTAADSLVTGVANGPGFAMGPETEVVAAPTVLATGGLPPFEPEPAPLPYDDPGPADVPAELLAGDVVPDAPHDLRVDAELHARAERVPGDDDDAPVWVGALAPDTDARCELRDPAPPPADPTPAAAAPGPVVDYRARDARSLLALMTARAQQTMPGWTPTGAADQTQMLLELFAERLDRVAYRQEVALSEGALPTALERRSVEDHVRLVDYVPDPGLSATTMLRFRLDSAAAGVPGIAEVLASSGQLVLGADTLVVNPDATDRIVVFGSEEDLAIVPALDSVRLADETDLEPGATTAIEVGDTDALLEGDLLALRPGRWLVVVGVDPEDPERLDPDVPAHVVRVTRVEVGTDTTRVLWDPRRPAPFRYDRARCRVLGNVVPAHHGIPLTPVTAGDAEDTIAVLEQEDLLAPWREQLTVVVDGAGLREIPVPVDRVSVRAPGWPFPGDAARSGEVQIRLAVDGEPWTRVEDLVLLEPGQDGFALRTGPGDRPVARFADSALPARTITVDLAVRVGLGTIGNVGVGAMTRLLALGPGGDRVALLGDGGEDRLELLRRLLTVTNPVTGVGGREPEDIETMRYRAPLGVRDALSAVVPADYERLVLEVPEVAAARAVVRDGPLAPVVSMTALLRDEDELAAAEEQGEAERLRRWAAARARLEEVRLLGFDVELVPPRFVPLDLDVVVDVDAWALDTAEHAVTQALSGADGLFDPDVSGLGGDVRVDAIHQRVLTVPGVRAVRVRRLRRLQQGAPERARAGVLAVDADEVAILRHPYGSAFPSGLLTVGVCEARP